MNSKNPNYGDEIFCLLLHRSKRPPCRYLKNFDGDRITAYICFLTGVGKMESSLIYEIKTERELERSKYYNGGVT